jgi:hypothetical protein
VTAADIEHWEGEHLLIVKTRTPTRGWRVVLEVRPGSEDSVLEFVVLGVAPEGAGAGEQEPGPEARTLMHIFEIGKGIDEVVVHGAENVLVLPTH